jgi:hypothetical protein
MTTVHVAEKLEGTDENLLQGVQELFNRLAAIPQNDIEEMLFIVRTKDGSAPEGDVHVGAVGNPIEVIDLLRQTAAELRNQYIDVIGKELLNRKTN